MEIIGIISSPDLVLYVFLLLWREILLFYFTNLKRRGGSNISDIILKLGHYICSHLRSYYLIKYLVYWKIIKFKTWYNSFLLWMLSVLKGRSRHSIDLNLHSSQNWCSNREDCFWRLFLSNNILYLFVKNLKRIFFSMKENPYKTYRKINLITNLEVKLKILCHQQKKSILTNMFWIPFLL